MPIQSSMGAAKLDVRYGDRSALPYYNGALLGTAEVSSCRAGRVYSLTTGGFLVPGLVATNGATGGQMPFFGLSGLDSNNYPDVQRDRGMPGNSDLGFTATATVTAAGNTITGSTIVYPGWYPDGTAPAVTIVCVGGGSATAVAVLTLGRVTALTITPTGTITSATATIAAPSSIGNAWSSPKLNGINIQSALTGTFATLRHNAAVELSTTEFDTTLSYAVGAPLTALSVGAAAGAKGKIRTLVTAATDIIIGHVAPAGVYVGPEGYSTLAFTPAFVLNGTPTVTTA